MQKISYDTFWKSSEMKKTRRAEVRVYLTDAQKRWVEAMAKEASTSQSRIISMLIDLVSGLRPSAVNPVASKSYYKAFSGLLYGAARLAAEVASMTKTRKPVARTVNEVVAHWERAVEALDKRVAELNIEGQSAEDINRVSKRLDAVVEELKKEGEADN